ncbi:MAG: VanW family protein [Fimbriimonadia bacterium]|jgi:vancomycin resistance protein YoaR
MTVVFLASALVLQTWHGLVGEAATPHVLASFSTELARAEWARNQNVGVAAKKLSGVYLAPGAEFSFNGLVGPRTMDAGYRDAPTFTPLGKLDSLAGGICQLSSTVYNAALLANLEIVERHPHSLTVRYLVPGRDATVSDYADLRFRNSREGPIRLVVELSGRQLKCTIMGSEPMREQVTIEVEKRTLANGQVVTRTYREVRSPVGMARALVSEDTYILTY